MIENKTRVVVCDSSKYKGKCFGKEGIVSQKYKTMIGVKLDGYKNPSSQLGVFWFKPESLEIVEDKKEKCILDKDFKVAEIQYVGSYKDNRTYPYALYDDDIMVDDLVVIHTASHGLCVAKVVSIGGDPDTVHYGREVICKVDMTAYEARKAKREKMEELVKRMDERVKHLQKTALYDLLAEKDEELSKMLDEYKKLKEEE